MTGGQWRVLGILLAILALELATSPNTRKALTAMGDELSGKSPKQAPIEYMKGAGGVVIGFTLSGVVLILIAAWQEGVATAIAILFLVIVLIMRGDVIGPTVQGWTDALTHAGKEGSK